MMKRVVLRFAICDNCQKEVSIPGHLNLRGAYKYIHGKGWFETDSKMLCPECYLLERVSLGQPVYGGKKRA